MVAAAGAKGPSNESRNILQVPPTPRICPRGSPADGEAAGHEHQDLPPHTWAGGQCPPGWGAQTPPPPNHSTHSRRLAEASVGLCPESQRKAPWPSCWDLQGMSPEHTRAHSQLPSSSHRFSFYNEATQQLLRGRCRAIPAPRVPSISPEP